MEGEARTEGLGRGVGGVGGEMGVGQTVSHCRGARSSFCFFLFHVDELGFMQIFFSESRRSVENTQCIYSGAMPDRHSWTVKEVGA